MSSRQHPHRRFNPLTGEWLLVSPHRTSRPWQGRVEKRTARSLPSYEPGCYLCPGNTRANGERNPSYEGTFVFDNDFAALLPDAPGGELPARHELFRSEAEQGLCRVVCFSPRHDLTLAHMDRGSITAVVNAWIHQYRSLGELDFINHVQIFENRGSIMGCSNPHPHGQIWANRTVPMIPSLETRCQHSYRERNRSCLLCDYLAEEQKRGERIVCENEGFVVVVPFWAVWPFEVMILPRRHLRDIAEMDTSDATRLADIIGRLGARYDNLFLTSFPYSMGIHQRPTDGDAHEGWHFHFHYYPPLLRSADVKKFMVGYEMLAQPQRDLTAEQSAQRLRECSEIHFAAASGR